MRPDISVVTAVRNAAVTVRDCLESVRTQTLAAEHVVVDGGSTDGTRELIAGYGGLIWVSAPDRGIYDAMNKGIGLASGEVVGFLGADDVFADDGVVARIAATFADPAVEACYGDLEYVDAREPARVVRSWRAGRQRAGSWHRGWMPPHPTFYARRGLYARLGGYDVQLGTAADYELMLRFLLKNSARTVYIPGVMVRMRTGGASNATFVARLRANRMDREAWRANGLRPQPWTLALKPLRKLGQFL